MTNPPAQSWWIALSFLSVLLALSLYWHHDTTSKLHRVCDLLSLYEIPRTLPEASRDEIDDACAEPEPDPAGKGE
jgi:hypothetical protein